MSLKEEQLKIVREELTSFMERVRENHRRAGQVASGRTSESMHVEVEGDEGTVFGRVAFGTLETGRRGGAVPKNFVSIIRQWMADKGIKAAPIPYVRKPSERWQPKYTAQERGDMSLASAIAAKIRKSGTTLYREGGRDDIYSNEIPRTTEAIMKKVLKLFTVDVESINRESKEE